MDEESDPEPSDAPERAGESADESRPAGAGESDGESAPSAFTAADEASAGGDASEDGAFEEGVRDADGTSVDGDAAEGDDRAAGEFGEDAFVDDESVIEPGDEADTDGGVEHVPSHAPEAPPATEEDHEFPDPGDSPGPADDGFSDDGLLGEGPEHDEEMPLTAHIEEMMRRLGVVFLVGGAVTLAVFGLGQSPDLFGYGRYLDAIPSSTWIIDFLWNHNIPGAPEMADRRPRLYGPLELLLSELKVAGLAGLVVGLPVFVYETYLFMRPGLYRRERRYYLAAVPTSLVLALIGMAFAHFVVLPSLFAYFTSYTQRAVFVAFGLKETFNLILVLMGYMAVIFQIPLFLMLAVMMNLVTRTWMEERRLIFWGVFATVAFFATPDPTGMAPIIVGATMIGLFEGTLALLRWTGN